MCDDDDEEDESLQDTACSSAAGQKVSETGKDSLVHSLSDNTIT
jgi:hypothetical protein